MRDDGLRGNALLGWVIVLFLVLPIAVVVPVSFTPERFLSLPGLHPSLRHYRALVEDPSWAEALRDSLIVAIGSTAVAVALGTAAAVGCWRLSSRLSEFIRVVMLLPIIVPAVVHALGFYRVWAEVGLVDTYTGVIAAHAMKGLPYVLITVSAALADFDQRLEMAARSLGASPARALRSVVLPAARPGILAGAAFAFVTSWDELVVTLFITSRGVVTLPRRIWDGVQDNISPTVAAVATLLILLTALVTVALARKRAA